MLHGELVAALLCMAQAWFVAGCPEGSAPRLGGVENWAKTVSGILNFAGLPGFLGNLDELYEQADEETPQWEAFIEAWVGLYGERAVTVSEIAADVQSDPHGYEDRRTEAETLRDALPGPLAGALARSIPAFKQALGNMLAKKAGVRFPSGLRIESAWTPM